MVSFEQALLVKAQDLQTRARKTLLACGCLLVLNAVVLSLMFWFRIHSQVGCR